MTKKDDDTNWGQHLSMGLQMVVGVVLGLIAGGWLDRKYNWAPWGTMVGSMLGIAGGLYLVIKEGFRANR